ncbi:cysteine--tRNA ligase [Qipengyuania sp. NPDC077563]|uniref:cysteine--tRNA ligase n=1 Tax=Qipengyuania sp. NPDC077563 TaxID=3364497 RepID=UPI00384F450B
MTETPLKLFNSLTRQIETFTPVHPGEARVYSCGPTVYNYPHIGNMRAYVFADILGRTLSWKGYDLTHIINITDVGHLTDDGDAGEDKMEKMAAQKSQSIWDIAKHYTEAYWEDVRALNIRQPAKWSVATDYIDEMIDFAQGIADKHCYELDSGLYFDVSTVDDYGKLARAVTEEGEGRIETVEGKRNSADFAIWRKTPAGETRQMEWDSPWGKGAPGWHLECSVMGGKLLGFPFDIHTGGIDHREIHHPNEIAQNQAHCCTGGLGEAENSGARIWMHNNFLVERSGKMSKSSGEFLRLQLLIDRGYHPLAYRMMCLQAHYRSELEFSWEGLGAALTRLKRIVMAVEKMRVANRGSDFDVQQAISSRMKRFDEAISDDLNTSVALTLLEGTIQAAIGQQSAEASLEKMDEVLGLGVLNLTREDLRIRPQSAEIEEEEIEAEILRRKDAKLQKDYATSDAIRASLAAKGVEVMDGDPLGWEWKLD